MQDRNSVKLCENPECDYNVPYIRPHYHVVTPNGSYVKYVMVQPKKKVYD